MRRLQGTLCGELAHQVAHSATPCSLVTGPRSLRSWSGAGHVSAGCTRRGAFIAVVGRSCSSDRLRR
jgi:hypothetical protein